MPLTDISLTLDEANRVLAQWDLSVTRGELTPGSGTANASVILLTPHGKLLLKRRNPRYSKEDWVRFDHSLMEHLHTREMPTPLGLPTKQGKRWARVHGHVYELYPFIEGDEHTEGDLEQIASAGELLARFQAATADFAPPCEKRWERYHSPSRIVEPFRSPLPSGALALRPEARETLEVAVRTAGELLERLPDDAYWALPQTIVHGDYHPANLKFRDDRVVGVFDLDWCTRQPRMVDLADGLLFFCGRRSEPTIAGDIWSLTQGFEMDEGLVRAFGAGYASPVTGGQSFRPGGMTVPGTPAFPTAAELRALPDLMRCRWLYCRVDAMQRKVPRERQVEFLLRDLLPPLRWLDDNESRIADGTLLGRG